MSEKRVREKEERVKGKEKKGDGRWTQHGKSTGLASARDHEHANEESAFTRIPADPSRPPLRSARLTLRRASLQVGHAMRHRSTLGRTLPSPLRRLVSSSLSLPTFYYYHHHQLYHHHYYHRRRRRHHRHSARGTAGHLLHRRRWVSLDPSPLFSPFRNAAKQKTAPNLPAYLLAHLRLRPASHHPPSRTSSTASRSYLVDRSVPLLCSSSQVRRQVARYTHVRAPTLAITAAAAAAAVGS